MKVLEAGKIIIELTYDEAKAIRFATGELCEKDYLDRCTANAGSDVYNAMSTIVKDE